MAEHKGEKKSGLSNIVAEWLWQHLAQWVDKGIITAQQKESILKLYLWPPHVGKGQAAPPEAKPANMILALEIIGALLIGLGIISFVALNWKGMEHGVKLGIIITIIAAIHGSGFILYQRAKFKHAGQALLFLGNLAYGAGIWLVAQMYHLPSSFPKGMLIWAVGVLPMAFIFKSKINYFLSTTLFILWTLGESFGNHVPQPVFLLVLLGALVPLSYYLQSKTGLFVCLATGGIWLYINNYLWGGNGISIHLLLTVGLYGLLLIILSVWHYGIKALQPYGLIYRFLGIGMVAMIIAIQPMYGLWSVQAPLSRLMKPGLLFWGTNVLLLSGSAALWLYLRGKVKDPGNAKLHAAAPYALLMMLYLLVLPYIKFSVLPGLFSLALTVFLLRHYLHTRTFDYLAYGYLALWLGGLSLLKIAPFSLLLLFLLYGLLAYVYSWQLEKNGNDKNIQGALRSLGLLIVWAGIFLMTFTAVYKEYILQHNSLPVSTDYWILAGLFYGAVVWLMKNSWNHVHPLAKKGLLKEERVVMAILGILPALLFGIVYYATNEPWFVLFINALFVVLCVTYLIIGYRRNEAYLKVLAFAFIGLFMLARYFELEFNLMHKSILLVSAGIVILVIGIAFEKNKAKVAVLDAE